MYAHGMRFADDAFGSAPEAAQLSWAKVPAPFVAASSRRSRRRHGTNPRPDRRQ